jgi:sulfatase maturation enzyme AslB (radical SAM superfamily)
MRNGDARSSPWASAWTHMGGQKRSLKERGLTGSLDQPQNGWHFDDVLYVRGWALGESGAPEKVSVYLGDECVGEAVTGLKRQDLARRYPDTPRSQWSGFQFCHIFGPRFAFCGELEAKASSTGGDEWTVGRAQVSLGRGKSTVSLVNVEITNACNLRCRWCTTHLRKSGMIEPGLFEDILREVAHSDRLDVRELHFYNGGGSMLHPEFAALMEVSRRVFSEEPVNTPKRVLVTNGTRLSEESIEALLGGGLDEVHVSIDGGTKDSYEEHRRGARWEAVISGARRLLEENEARGHPVKTALLMIDLGVQPAPEFERLAGGFDVFAPRAAHSWDGSVELDGLAPQPPNRLPCWHVFNNIVVLWNGDVTACCADLLGRGVMGNVASSSLAAHWEGPHHRMRAMQCEGDEARIGLCRACSIP